MDFCQKVGRGGVGDGRSVLSARQLLDRARRPRSRIRNAEVWRDVSGMGEPEARSAGGAVAASPPAAAAAASPPAAPPPAAAPRPASPDFGADDFTADDLDALDAIEQAHSRRASGASAPPPSAAATPARSQPPPPPPPPRPPPATMDELFARAEDFAARAALMPPPPPPGGPGATCPGVFGRGCGGRLAWVEGFEGGGAPFWACAKGRGACSWRHHPPRRRLSPQLDLLAPAAGVLEAAPRLGAEEAVAACGGVAALLRCAGADLRRALPGAAPAAAVRFPLGDYASLRALLQRAARPPLFALLPPEGDIPRGTLAALAAPGAARAPAAEAAARYAALPAPLEAALLPFQREGVKFGLARRGRVLLADEMGVGKTVQAIALAAAYRADSWPLLVVAPASLRLPWAEELEKWLPDLAPADVRIVFDRGDRPAAGAPLPPVTVTSFRMLEHLTCRACKRTHAWREEEGPELARAAAAAAAARGRAPPPPPGCRAPGACFATLGWRMLVVDESHNLRATAGAADAQHTEAARAAATRAARVVFLSGTPSLSKPFDLWNQIAMIRPGLLDADRQRFADAYCHRRLLPFARADGGAGQKWDASGLTRGRELHALLRQEVMVRRLKREVLAELPPKRRQVVRLPRPPAEQWPRGGGGAARRGADDSDASSDEEAEEGGGAAGASAGASAGGSAGAGGSAPGSAGRQSAAHRAGLAKCQAAIEWLCEQLGLGGEGGADADGDGGGGEGGECGGGEEGAPEAEAPPKWLVFAHHKSVMNKLAAALDARLTGAGVRRGGGAAAAAPRWDFVRIDGDTDAEGRRAAVERFRADARVRAALLSVTAAGVGLDFSAASAVAFVELPAEVSMVRQAEDRAHRQGAARPVNVFFLCARGTVDERHWQRLSASLARVEAMLDGDGAGGGGAGGGGAGAQGLVVDAVVTLAGGSQALTPDEAPEADAGAAAGGGDGGAATAAATAAASAAAAPEAERAPPAPPQPESSAAAEAAAAAAPPCASPEPPDGWWFEVSPHTQRVHLHAAADRAAPLRLSLPMEALLAPGAPALRALAAAVGRQLAAPPGGAAAPEFVAGVGPVAVDLAIVSSAARLRSALGAAAAFARDWRELGSAARHRLARALLQPPLDAAAEAAAAGAAAAGALGAGTDRYAGGGAAAAAAAAPPLPAGAERRDVLVRFPGGRRQRYAQVVLPATGARLCLHCAAAVPGGAAVPLAEALDTAALLFCSPECERRRAVTASSAAMRRALFKHERGVCVLCGVDAAGLVRRLQAVERGSRRCRAARGALLDAAAPAFAARLSAKAREALLAHATQGAAWQADHEVPVYAGGGLCDVDNLRTLCTPCHAGVTAAQARARGGARRAARVAADGRARRRPAKRAAREYLSESE
jgi:hypothetical protein